MDVNFKIKKSDGEVLPYDHFKLIGSLERSGANGEIIREISRKIESQLYEGISTSQIYNMAFKMLKQFSKPVAAKYKLKRAIMELGPSGYPFEKYFGELMKFQGFSCEVGVIVNGNCVPHEVDVYAKKDDRKVFVECKYHNRPGTKSDVKIPLYIHSRFRDIKKVFLKAEENREMKFECWVVTNTEFTTDAIKYGLCSGMRLIGWDFPKKGNLKEFIELAGLYPVTCLTTLTKREKSALLSHNIVLSNELVGKRTFLENQGIRRTRLGNILKEVRELCNLGDY